MFFLFENKNWENFFFSFLFVWFTDIEHNTEPALPGYMLRIL